MQLKLYWRKQEIWHFQNSNSGMKMRRVGVLLRCAFSGQCLLFFMHVPVYLFLSGACLILLFYQHLLVFFPRLHHMLSHKRHTPSVFHPLALPPRHTPSVFHPLALSREVAWQMYPPPPSSNKHGIVISSLDYTHRTTVTLYRMCKCHSSSVYMPHFGTPWQQVWV